MANSGDHHHRVKRIVLPSGKTIEVVYFDHSGEESQGAAPEPMTDTEAAVHALHLCPDCDEDLVYPTRWDEARRGYWNVTLRCPGCEWTATSEYPQDLLDAFDEELDRGTEILVKDLKQLTRANMAEEIERFTAALDADAIWPEDF